MVCDRWFAAHPGGTYPNRWAFLSGEMPHTRNFSPDDPQMGFIKTRTIFDYLTSARIEWAYYESNIGMLRMYDQYRLDNTRVLPYGEKGEHFAARANAGQLPPVVHRAEDHGDPAARAGVRRPSAGQHPAWAGVPGGPRSDPPELAALEHVDAGDHLRRTWRLLRPHAASGHAAWRFGMAGPGRFGWDDRWLCENAP